MRAGFAQASVLCWCPESIFYLLAPGPVEEMLGTGASHSSTGLCASPKMASHTGQMQGEPG